MRKKTRGRNIQSIVCAPTLKRKNALGKEIEIPNPEAGKRKQILHRPTRTA